MKTINKTKILKKGKLFIDGEEYGNIESMDFTYDTKYEDYMKMSGTFINVFKKPKQIYTLDVIMVHHTPLKYELITLYDKIIRWLQNG